MASLKGGPAGLRVPDLHGRVRTKIRPGAKGTRRLLAEYGDRLVCVRYRYDEALRRQLKTVEIIVSETPWNPEPFRKVFVSIEAWETRLRKEIMRAGGRWNPDRAQWELRYNRAMKLGLRDRWRSEAAPTSNAARNSSADRALPPTPQRLILIETKKSLPAETSTRKPR